MLMLGSMILMPGCVMPEQDAAQWPDVMETITAGRLQRVLNHGVDLEAYSEEGLTALEVAVWNGRPFALVETLLDAGAQVDVLGLDEESILHGAVRHYDGEVGPIVERLIAAGVDPHRTNSKGRTAITLAALAGWNDSFTWFLDAGLVHWGRGENGPVIVKDLLATNGWVALGFPSMHKRIELALTTWQRTSPDTWLAEVPLPDLLFARRGWSWRDLNGNIHTTQNTVSMPVLEFLDRLGFPAQKQTSAGFNFLHVASKYGHGPERLIPWLLERGVDPMQRTVTGALPIHLWARREGWHDSWREDLDDLVEAGNPPLATDGYGNTPIELAWFAYGQPNYRMIEALEAHGAPVLDLDGQPTR